MIGYVFGLFQTSYLYGKTKGIDIREHGSGNAGTTNALRTLGKKAGAITLAGDCIKCILAVLTVRLIFGASHPEMLKLLMVYAAAGTILGHNFPFYLGFRVKKWFCPLIFKRENRNTQTKNARRSPFHKRSREESKKNLCTGTL